MFVFKQKTANERRISDWSSDVCSSDLPMRMEVQLSQLKSAEPVPAQPEVQPEEPQPPQPERVPEKPKVEKKKPSPILTAKKSDEAPRSEESRVGKESVKTCMFRCAAYP